MHRGDDVMEYLDGCHCGDLRVRLRLTKYLVNSKFGHAHDT